MRNKLMGFIGVAAMSVLLSGTAWAQAKPGPRPGRHVGPRVDKKDCHNGLRDRLEDRRDRREDVLDRREDIRDAKHDGGKRDRIEDRRDRREDVRDRREDLRDRKCPPRRAEIKQRLHEFQKKYNLSPEQMREIVKMIVARHRAGMEARRNGCNDEKRPGRRVGPPDGKRPTPPGVEGQGTPPERPHGNNGLGNGQDPQPPGNPPVNDGAGRGPGRPGNRGGRNR